MDISESKGEPKDVGDDDQQVLEKNPENDDAGGNMENNKQTESGSSPKTLVVELERLNSKLVDEKLKANKDNRSSAECFSISSDRDAEENHSSADAMDTDHGEATNNISNGSRNLRRTRKTVSYAEKSEKFSGDSESSEESGKDKKKRREGKYERDTSFSCDLRDSNTGRTGGKARKIRPRTRGPSAMTYINREDTGEDDTSGECNSDSDYAVKKRSKRRKFKHRKIKKKEEREEASLNESDEEFERMLCEEEPKKENDSDDSDSYKNRTKKRKLMKFAETKTGDGTKSVTSVKDFHREVCGSCGEGGELVCCLICPYTFHLFCLTPPLEKIPKGDWECPRCTAEPLPGKVNRIISWRWENKKYLNQYLRMSKKKRKVSARPQKKFFVHWHERSYWQCSWLSEFELDLFHKGLLYYFYKRSQSDDFILEEEESVVGDTRDPLYERFYRYGVLPEWLKIHRIINQRVKSGKSQYLVKWRGVPYTQLSWEEEENQDIEDFKTFQEIYHEWKTAFTEKYSRALEDETRKPSIFKHIKIPPAEPITSKAEPYEGQPPFVDASIGLNLHHYQLEGLNWLRKSWNKCVNTILADEMGLGKTIQAIMFIYSLFKEGHSDGPFLITVPLSTIVNWEREFELWAPDLYVVTYTGFADERGIIREHEFSYEKGATSTDKVATRMKGEIKFHVLLTSYEGVSIDIACLSSIKWAVMIVDEAHRLRNTSAKFFKDLECYKTQYKLLLTGTPLQNNLTELFNMLRFLCVKKKKTLRNLQILFEGDEEDEEKHSKRVKRLHAMLKPHMLRRVKEEVLQDLPTKSEIIVKVELAPKQKEYYKYILTKNFGALNSQSGGHWATLMMVFVDLQKCCNHPYLFSTAMMEAPVTKEDIYETSALVESSGKLSVLQKMLKKLKQSKNRVLIFSHFTKMLDILEDFLQGIGYEYERIDGSITGADRQASIDRFNAPKAPQFIFLLSTKAGGLGINLATADTVILYDSDWNPHNDIQAFSRAHRIGQKKSVMIYRFITRNSIEERIAQVARNKLMLNHVVLEAGKAENFTLTKKHLNEIIRHGTEELFKEGSDVRDNFTDDAIKDLLNRSKIAIDQKQKLSDISPDDIFSSVKVVSYVTKEENSCDEESNSKCTGVDYWEKLLGPHCERKVKEPSPELLGKRVRKKVNYKDPSSSTL